MTTTRDQLKPIPEATIANLFEMTGDPIDTMKLVADLYALTAYRAERAAAAEAGASPPDPPPPHSRYLRMFMTGLRAKLAEVVRHFAPAELERMKRIAPALVASIDAADPALSDEIIQLVCMSPVDAAAWIRDHLVEIEMRFAS